jgi:hypothetical protein
LEPQRTQGPQKKELNRDFVLCVIFVASLIGLQLRQGEPSYPLNYYPGKSMILAMKFMLPVL